MARIMPGNTELWANFITVRLIATAGEWLRDAELACIMVNFPPIIQEKLEEMLTEISEDPAAMLALKLGYGLGSKEDAG